MWKLTIYQMKKYETWESEQEVSVESNDFNELLLTIGRIEKMKGGAKTRYEIKEVEEDVH